MCRFDLPGPSYRYDGILVFRGAKARPRGGMTVELVALAWCLGTVLR